jgi:predicted amidohydrolase
MPNLTVSLVQTPVLWEDKSSNLSMLGKKIMGIPEKTELVILPEMFSTGFSMHTEVLAETMDGPTVDWMRKTAAQKKSILTGSLIIKEIQDGEPFYFNRLVWMQPDGHFGYYDKRHLFAYGKEDRYYSPGNRRLLASVKGWKINLQVCYDLRFPVWQRQPASVSPLAGEPVQEEPAYDILVVVANWPATRIHAWKTLLQARAIENQSFVIGVNRTGTDGNGLAYPGESMVVGPLGEILHALSGKEEVLSITLNKDMTETVRRQFPFWKDADHFLIQP